MKLRPLTLSLLLAGTALAAIPARADTDPPGRIGRVSYVSGTVSTHGPDDTDWNYADLNSPVTSGDAFWNEPNARSEIQVGPAEIRIDQATELDITRLDDSGTELNLPQGVINLHLHSPPPGGFLIDTPAGQVVLTQAGSYHIDGGDGQGAPAQVAVLEGQAQFNGPSGAINVRAGEAATVGGNTPVSVVAFQPTDFDNWALSREHRERAPQSLQYVSPDETGYQDLDNYGQWSQTPDYGAVWYPQNVASDWQPYSDGQWQYDSPWGWTWVDAAPWGFTPFHYGRWVNERGRWGWWPGAVSNRPVYAPALVVFVGGGAGGLPVGWVPLAPNELYRPWYARNASYWRDVNRSSVRRDQIDNLTINNYDANRRTYANHYANAAHGSTFVHPEDFQRGARVHGSAVHVRPETLASTPAANRSVGAMRPDLQHRDDNNQGGMFHRAAPQPSHDAGRPAAVTPPAAAVVQRTTPQQTHSDAGRDAGQVHAPGPAFHRGGHMMPTAGTPAPAAATPEPARTAPSNDGHAPGPAIHRPERHEPQDVTAPNQDMPDRHTQAEAPRIMPAAHQPDVTSARERDDRREAQPAQSAPHVDAPHAEISHPQQTAPLAATPHGWQRGNGGGGNHGADHPQAAHVEQHAQQHAQAPQHHEENHAQPQNNGPDRK